MDSVGPVHGLQLWCAELSPKAGNEPPGTELFMMLLPGNTVTSPYQSVQSSHYEKYLGRVDLRAIGLCTMLGRGGVALTGGSAGGQPCPQLETHHILCLPFLTEEKCAK